MQNEKNSHKNYGKRRSQHEYQSFRGCALCMCVRLIWFPPSATSKDKNIFFLFLVGLYLARRILGDFKFVNEIYSVEMHKCVCMCVSVDMKSQYSHFWNRNTVKLDLCKINERNSHSFSFLHSVSSTSHRTSLACSLISTDSHRIDSNAVAAAIDAAFCNHFVLK